MVRSSLICLTAVLLTACGNAGGNGKLTPTLDGAILAPDGAAPVLTDFVNVCSALVLDGKEPASVFPVLGWEIPDEASTAEMAAFGGVMADKDQAGQMPLSLQLIPMGFPHLEGATCTVSAFGGSDLGSVNIADLDGIEGMAGKVDTFEEDGESVGLGRWSGVAKDGAVVMIYAMKTNRGEFLNLSLTKSKPVEPALNATK